VNLKHYHAHNFQLTRGKTQLSRFYSFSSAKRFGPFSSNRHSNSMGLIVRYFVDSSKPEMMRLYLLRSFPPPKKQTSLLRVPRALSRGFFTIAHNVRPHSLGELRVNLSHFCFSVKARREKVNHRGGREVTFFSKPLNAVMNGEKERVSLRSTRLKHRLCGGVDVAVEDLDCNPPSVLSRASLFPVFYPDDEFQSRPHLIN